MILSIKHITTHVYDGAVSFGEHALFLRTLESHSRRVHAFEVRTQPESRQRWVRDVYGNVVRLCNFGLQEASELTFTAVQRVEVLEENPFDFILEPYAVGFPFAYRAEDEQALRPFMGKSAPLGALRVLDWFYSAVPEPMQHPSVVQLLWDLSVAVRRDIAYQARYEEGVQRADETLQLRTGSCRDMAVLFMAVVRQLGLAARFVSGYLFDPPVGEDGGAHAFNRAVGSMHAWVEVYLPGAGWKGFDPTNGIVANHYFLPCAVSHDPLAVNPIRGAYFSKTGNVQAQMRVELQIEEVSHG